MTSRIDSLLDVSAGYDAIVLDQWGVLHDGSAPYSGAVACLASLKAAGQRLAVLSNSGKRGAPNADRITGMGFDADLFDLVMTSGEALWREIASGSVPYRRLHAIERAKGEARAWSEGLNIMLTSLAEAEAILLMGLPDGSGVENWRATLASARNRNLAIYCTNPDKASPRAGGVTVVSPGALAQAYEKMGGTVRYFGKPHTPVFEAVQSALHGARLLMVGDSLEHDIQGAHAVGWDSVLIQGGLYGAQFASGSPDAILTELCAAYDVAPPTYRMKRLS